MKLYVIIDTSSQTKFTPMELLDAAIGGGADMIQLRDKKTKTGELLRLAREMRVKCKKAGVPLIVNDRVDIALLSDADGVHLGKEDFPIRETRKILGNKIIGVTAHSLDEALTAQAEGADYIGFGHIFPTTSKQKSTSPVGISALNEVCSRVEIPVFAIGGIAEENVGEVARANAAGVAVIAAVCGSPEPDRAVRRLKEIIRGVSLTGERERQPSNLRP